MGLAISLVPILLRSLPPLNRNPETQRRDPNYAITIIGLVAYALLTGGTVLLLND